MNYIGFDNGVSGTIGIITIEPEGIRKTHFFKTPVFKEQNYTKKKAMITRIDFNKLLEVLQPFYKNSFVMMERPMVNPTRHKATTSALRSLEASLNVLQLLDLPMIYVDSKEWQRQLLPKGSGDLKQASKDIGCRLFPEHKELIIKHKDADGLLIAEHCRRTIG